MTFNKVAFTILMPWLAVLACHGQQATGSPGASSPEMVKYLRDSITWAHAERVIDSLSRTINTDSLYTLYRTALTAENPAPIIGQITCTGTMFMRQYGSLPAQRALKRMQDTLKKPGEQQLFDRLTDRMAAMSPDQRRSTAVGTRNCGPLGPMAPDSVDGVSTRWVVRKPYRP